MIFNQSFKESHENDGLGKNKNLLSFSSKFNDKR